MEKTPSFLSIELELQELLSNGSSPAEIARVFHVRWKQQTPSLEDLSIFSHFMMKAGLNSTLSKILSELAYRDVLIPWGHLVESLYHATPAIPEKLKKSLIDGATDQKMLTHLIRSYMLDHYEESLIELRNSQSKRKRVELDEKKIKLLQEAEMMRSQGLESEEEKILTQLKRLFPADGHIQSLLQKNQERRALGLIIDRKEREKRRWANIKKTDTPDEETQKLLSGLTNEMTKTGQSQEQSGLSAEESSELQRDFAVAHIMWENYESALHFLSNDQISWPNFWLRQEVLLQARRYVDLLQEIEKIEKQFHQDPEVTFAVAYLRAQALWGLGQKKLALQTLDDLLTVRPDYRSAMSLRDSWREELQA